jgi:hypothetical protein
MTKDQRAERNRKRRARYSEARAAITARDNV